MTMMMVTEFHNVLYIYREYADGRELGIKKRDPYKTDALILT